MKATSLFVDEATLIVRAGCGGDGVCSFRRERARPRGGPNGGNGGRGGDVIALACGNVATLADFLHQSQVKAGDGKRGGGDDKTGAAGKDAVLRLPCGTLIKDAPTGARHADLAAAGASAILARGGGGGFGNAHFKSAVNRAPRRTTRGAPGEERTFRLELRSLADAGLLGMPNAGKSSLLRAISAARPKVGDYPFTTLAPHLGAVADDDDFFIIADVPGLIRGAAGGAGLGLRFLRHLSRCPLLLHIVDGAAADPQADCAAVAAEIRDAPDQTIAAKPRWIVINKIDLLDGDARANLRAAFNRRATPVFPVSAASGEGCERLIMAVADFLRKKRGETAQARDAVGD